MSKEEASKEPRVPAAVRALCYYPATPSHVLSLRCPVVGFFQGQGIGHLPVWGLRVWDRFLEVQGRVKWNKEGIKRVRGRGARPSQEEGLLLSLV